MSDEKNAYQKAVIEIEAAVGPRHLRFKPDGANPGSEGLPHEIYVDGYGVVKGKTLAEATKAAVALVKK